jgi:stromal membrane-associated protein
VPGGAGGFGQVSAGAGSPFGAKPAQPVVAADEEFGGWSSAAPPSPVVPRSQPVAPTRSQPKPAAPFAASEDLFGNVWE